MKILRAPRHECSATGQPLGVQLPEPPCAGGAPPAPCEETKRCGCIAGTRETTSQLGAKVRVCYRYTETEDSGSLKKQTHCIKRCCAVDTRQNPCCPQQAAPAVPVLVTQLLFQLDPERCS